MGSTKRKHAFQGAGTEEKAEDPMEAASKKKAPKMSGFESLGLAPEVYRGVKKKGYRVPTPIQRKAMPLALEGRDVVAMARTGSGKSAAFLIPILERLRAHSLPAWPRALVLAPTRELALQTVKFAKQLGKYTDLRFCALVGGDSMESQFEQLHAKPDVIVATPGRLVHHLEEVDDFSLQSAEMVVMDEADRLFELGFSEQIKDVLKRCSESRQTMLFSATLPSILADFAQAGLRDPSLVRLDAEMAISDDLEPHFFLLRQEDKPAALMHLLSEVIITEQEQALVFVSTRHHVELLMAVLRREGFGAAGVYGSMDQEARRQAMNRFRAGQERVLVVTDVAARGLDIPLLDNAVNYDFPAKPKLFVHRVGRVARCGRKGRAFSFVQRDELGFLVDLHLFLGRQVKCADSEPPDGRDDAQRIVDEALRNNCSLLGRYPPKALGKYEERFKSLLATDTDVANMLRYSQNALKLYLKTRPPASAESHNRAKELPSPGTHPLLYATLDSALRSKEYVDFTQRMKSFRPANTVLEADIAPAKRMDAFGGTNVEGAPHCKKLSPVMRAKREAHERRNGRSPSTGRQASPAFAEEGAEGGGAAKLAPATAFSGKYKDDDYFIDNAPKQSHYKERGYEVEKGNNIRDAVLEVQEEDAEGVKRQQSVRRWDQRKKKYVMISQGSRERIGRQKVRTESGQVIRKGKGDKGSGIYERWRKKQTNQDTQADSGSKTNESGRRPKGRGNVANKGVRSELRSASKILKERKEELNRKKQRRQGPNSSKGKGKGKKK